MYTFLQFSTIYVYIIIIIIIIIPHKLQGPVLLSFVRLAVSL